MKIKRLVTLLLTLLIASASFSLVACGGGNEGAKDNGYKSLDEIKGQLTSQVDYTDSAEKFNFYTYKSISDGTYKLGSNPYSVGETFITDEKIIEYFDSGMSYICPQTLAQVNKVSNKNTPFEETNAGKFLDQVARLGYKESVVLVDFQLYMPYNNAKGAYKLDTYKTQYNNGTLSAQGWEDVCDSITVIGTEYSWQYPTVEAFDAWVEENMRQYYFHEAFQGIFLPDEPAGLYLNIIGETYQAVRRVEKKLKAEKAQLKGVNVEDIEDMYVNLNLYPFWGAQTYFFPVETSFGSLEERNCEAYRRYVEKYFETTKADFVQADIYPLGIEGITSYYLSNLEIMAELAAENDAKIIVVTQANNDANHRVATEESIRYINNLTFGYGAVNIGYYAYYTLDDSVDGQGAYDMGYVYDDNGCMMSRFGDKTAVYDIVKNANAEAQSLAPVIKHFDYTTSKRYTEAPTSTAFDDAYMYFGDRLKSLDFSDFAKLTSVTFDKEVAVVTELYDDAKDNYMYMVMNTTDPYNKGSLYYQTTTLTFTSNYNKVLDYFNGGYKVIDLDENSSVSVKMRPGEAHYLIPFTA